MQILTELRNAEKSILVAVAWFTDYEIFNLILNKARSGLIVELITMNDEINKNRKLIITNYKM